MADGGCVAISLGFFSVLVANSFENSSTGLNTSPLCRDSGNWSGPVYAPGSLVGTACACQIVSDLRACWDRVTLRRRTVKVTSERQYHGVTPRSETASRRKVRNSNVVEEGRVENVPVASPALGPPGPSKIRSSPSKRKRKISRSPVKLPRKFEISSSRLVPRSDLW